MTSARIVALQTKLTEIASDLSGYDPSDLSPSKTFLELGFDSLFLTQLASVYQKKFNHKITFRQLINDLPTIDALSAFLDEQLPPDAVAQAPAPDPERDAPAAAQSAGMSVAAGIAMPAPARGALKAPPEGLAAILAEQVALMAKQLEMLREMRGSAPTAASAAKAPSLAKPATEKAPSGAMPLEQPSMPAGFGPDIAAASEKKSLKPQQRAHLDRLIASYNAKTAGSKAATQRDRAVHADPRTAAGFNPLWKEMVYPIVVKKSHGAHLWDVDDNQYIDILNGFGPNFFGHRAPFITNALKEQLEDGYEVGPQTPRAGDAARLLCELTGMDRVSWVNTGSEAVQAAIRIARTVTGRDKIVVFNGDYHGNFDEVLVRGVGQRTLPLAPGIPFNSVENIIVLDYGESSAIDAVRANADEIAAVLVEPVQSRRPEFQPREFLHELRALTREEEIVLVFDEVITGFRIRPGGAQEFFGVEADMATYGKIIGGGMPIGVVAGRAKFMDTFDGGLWGYGDDSKPTAGVTFFAGTFVRHPMAIAAAHASLTYLKATGPALQERVNKMTTRLATTLNAFFEERGVNIHVAHFASQMFIRVQDESDLAILFFYHMRARGIHVLENFPSYVTAAHTDEDIDAIVAAAKESVIEMQADAILPPPPAGVVDDLPRVYPLTDGQRAMWFAAQLDPLMSCAFNESDMVVIDGPLDQDKFIASVTSTLKNHEAFSFRFDQDGAVQTVDPDAEFSVDVFDFSDNSEADRGAALNAHLAKFAKMPFDLENGPIVRTHLIRMAPDRRVFVIFCHHLSFDGYSSGIVIKEIAERYRALRGGGEPDLPETVPYGVYAFAENSAANNPDYTQSLNYWREVFSDGAPDLLELPLDYERGDTLRMQGATIHRALSPDLLTDLKATAATVGVSLNTLLFTAYSALLARLSGQEDFVVGIPASGQSMSGINTVGYCVRIIPIRTRPSLDKSIKESAAENMRAISNAVQNQEVSIAAIARDLALPRLDNRLILTETVFNYTHYFSDLKIAGCEVTARENKRAAVYHDLFFNIIETERQLNIYWDYCTELYDAKSINQWIDYFIKILTECARNPASQIGSALTTPSQISVSENFSDDAQTGRDSTELAYHAFDKHAAATPDKVAVIFENQSLTYRELKMRSDAVAKALSENGARRGDIVSVLLDRSPDLIAAAIGAWKAGCTYLPLDREFPENRLAYMMKDSGAQFMVTDDRRHPVCNAAPSTILVVKDILSPANLTQGVWFSPEEPAESAYILYTSGSTGDPKGVANGHAALVNFLRSMAHTPGFEATDRLLAVTTPSFDISFLELFLPLSVGGSIVLSSSEAAIDGFLLGDLIKQHGVTVVQGTPATWRLFLDAEPDVLEGVRALCGGEPLTRALAQGLLPVVRELWNMYGPTETTVWSTCKNITDAGDITAGIPIDNTVIYVVDRLGHPTLPNVPGEILIGGEGVALGYHGRTDATAEKFRADPHRADGRIYATGDWGKLRANGELQILGRRDDQVKIRGHRIELGEIESALEKHLDVRQAAAAVRNDHTGEALLVAYFVPRDGEAPTASDLRRWLRQSLPHYMIPQMCVEIDAVPLTNNGKIDRKRLPEPEGLRAAQPDPIAPRTEKEQRIAEIWREILDVDGISVTDNFFELGGQSLQVARMVAKLRNDYGYRIPAQAVVFETLEQLAADREAAGAVSE